MTLLLRIKNQDSTVGTQITTPCIMHQFKVHCCAPGGEHVLSKGPEGSGRSREPPAVISPSFYSAARTLGECLLL